MLDNVLKFEEGKPVLSGRKDAQGQEQVIETGVVRSRMVELLRLHEELIEARQAFNDEVKATAEKAGLLSAVVRKFVKIKAEDRLEEETRKVEQLCLLFADVA